jgi:hypothetical protein
MHIVSTAGRNQYASVAFSPARARVRVFISSPFDEWLVPDRKLDYFQVRADLADALSTAGCEPWLFEREGKSEQRRLFLDDTEIIARNIRASHVLVAVVKTRAGRWMSTRPTLHATFHELLMAMEYGKPVFLYVLGKEHDNYLKRYLTVLADPLFLVRYREFRSGKANDLVEQAIADVRAFRVSMPRYFRKALPSGAARVEDFGSNMLQESISKLRQFTAVSDFSHAREVACSIPLQPQVWMKDADKNLYAELLADVGGVYANTLDVNEAIRAKKIAMKLCAETGNIRGWFSRVQEISGILNMYGHRNAELWNLTALQGAGRSHDDALIAASLDSRGSILLTQRRYGEAAVALETVVRKEKDPSPYNLIKWKTAQCRKAGDAGLRAARHFTDSVILPLARRSRRSLVYALKGAARFAVWDHDYGSAIPLLAEARRLTLSEGHFHSLIELESLLNVCRDHGFE